METEHCGYQFCLVSGVFVSLVITSVIVKEKKRKEAYLYSAFYILCISQSAQACNTVLPANTPSLPYRTVPVLLTWFFCVFFFWIKTYKNNFAVKLGLHSRPYGVRTLPRQDVSQT